jgi:hypothetical protein
MFFIGVLLVPSLAASAGSEYLPDAQSSPLSFDFAVSPRALPRNEPAPAKLRLRTRLSSPTGSPHPPPASNLTIRLDRFLSLSTRGLPSCAARLQVMSPSSLPERCKRALVGRGKMETSIAFPEAEELRQRSHLLVFNGGTRAGSTRLWLYARVNFPVPAQVVTPIDFKPARNGRYGTKAVISVPRIAGGAGSIAWLSLSIRRGYSFKRKHLSVLTARCPDGKLQAAAEASFAEGMPPTGSVETVRPCVASG